MILTDETQYASASIQLNLRVKREGEPPGEPLPGRMPKRVWRLSGSFALPLNNPYVQSYDALGRVIAPTLSR